MHSRYVDDRGDVYIFSNESTEFASSADMAFNPYELNDAYLGQQERSQIMLSGNGQWSI